MGLFYLAGGMGVALVAAGLWRAFGNLRFLARSVPVDGHLVKWEIAQPGAVGGPSTTHGRRAYRPIVAFRAADGSEQRVTGATYSLGFHKPGTATGARIAVRYDPADPASAKVATFSDFWLFPLLSLAVGAACLAIAANA